MTGKFYNNFKTALLLGAMTGLILFIGSFWGQQGLIFALIFAGISNFVAYFFSDRIALATMRAQQVGPDHELYQIVQRLAQRADMPMPRVYISPHPAPNAFATGRGRDGEGVHPIAGLLVLVLGPIAAGLIQAAISRSREFNADKAGAEFLGNPLPLASALEKIHHASRRIPLAINPAFNELFIIEPLNPMRSIANLFATHPPLEQRLANLIGRESTGRFRYAA